MSFISRKTVTKPGLSRLSLKCTTGIPHVTTLAKVHRTSDHLGKELLFHFANTVVSLRQIRIGALQDSEHRQTIYLFNRNWDIPFNKNLGG